MSEAIRDIILGKTNAALINVLVREICLSTVMSIDDARQQHKESGIYCLYYLDTKHPYYGALGKDEPIYIGKAISNLSTRLRDHQKSVQQSTNLNESNLKCCIIPVKQEWCAGCEQALIDYYTPLWNLVVKGFGNHAPGSGRKHQVRSMWDMLHPGRVWAATMTPGVDLNIIKADILKWCKEKGRIPKHKENILVCTHFSITTTNDERTS